MTAREMKREQPQPLPAFLFAPFFARSLTLVPHSMLLIRTETLATQARPSLSRWLQTGKVAEICGL